MAEWDLGSYFSSNLDWHPLNSISGPLKPLIHSKNSRFTQHMETASYDRWIGNTESHSDDLTIYPMVAMAATLDKQNMSFEAGSELPPLWHWLYFLAPARQSMLGPDGHPQRGDFLPPIPLPRRMWAGSRFEFKQPLRAGQQVERTSEIKSVTVKQGRSGTLAFVCVRHQLSCGEELALIEEHDIVYRDNPAADAAPPTPVAAPASADFSKTFSPDPVLLFRYSALTFNGHRIHYDRDYVTGTEGYPGLIVHGPLLATLLVDLLLESVPGCQLTHFEFKAIHPVFDLHDFTVCGLQPDQDNKSELWIRDHNGSLCMKATATVAPKA